jgi:hypothetical protein
MDIAIARRDAVREHAAVCDCGQDLDCCTGDHCPRCGCVVRHRG